MQHSNDLFFAKFARMRILADSGPSCNLACSELEFRMPSKLFKLLNQQRQWPFTNFNKNQVFQPED